MKAIVIDEPWVSLITSGQKTWEMRKNGCAHRGTVALIRKGSGHVVGTATVIGSLPPLTTAEAYAAAEDKHRIPPERQERARFDGWHTPWVLAEARPLARPVPYRHPNGAVIWVNLEADVARAVTAQMENFHSEGPAPTSLEGRNTTSTPPSSAPAPNAAPDAEERYGSGDTRAVTITGGNLRNSHIYLPLEFFPADAIGGKNKAEAAPRQLTVSFEPGQTVSVDIDGSKRIFRSRPPVADFFIRAQIQEGDVVLIRRLHAYAYSIVPRR